MGDSYHYFNNEVDIFRYRPQVNKIINLLDYNGVILYLIKVLPVIDEP